MFCSFTSLEEKGVNKVYKNFRATVPRVAHSMYLLLRIRLGSHSMLKTIMWPIINNEITRKSTIFENMLKRSFILVIFPVNNKKTMSLMFGKKQLPYLLQYLFINNWIDNFDNQISCIVYFFPCFFEYTFVVRYNFSPIRLKWWLSSFVTGG